MKNLIWFAGAAMMIVFVLIHLWFLNHVTEGMVKRYQNLKYEEVESSRPHITI